MTGITIKYTKWHDSDGFDCELCGYHENHGEKLSYNGDCFWEESSIGCYGGEIPDINAATAYINMVEEVLLESILKCENRLYVFHPRTTKDQIEDIITTMFDKFRNLEFGDLLLCHQAMKAYVEDFFGGMVEIKLKEEDIYE